MGYGGGYTQIKEAVREIRNIHKEVFMPLSHRPGEGQVDFGYALARTQIDVWGKHSTSLIVVNAV
jgi:hypothetical protein